MKNIYYAIWTDTIINIKKNPMHKKDWKAFSLFYISVSNAFCFCAPFMLASSLFELDLPILELSFFPVDSLNSFFSFFIQFWLPFIPVNYFLILHKNRYKQFIKKYSDRKARLFAFYFVGSILIWILHPVVLFLCK